ncbi:hypothetical protein ACIQU4_05720 [Streptomyces sp. NPDC090741]|uniref:hypothetical protein n=1 Tax=Streptomyces sp. NPDC090741 TaxID=3365967 RepID=UPI00381D8DB9
MRGHGLRLVDRIQPAAGGDHEQRFVPRRNGIGGGPHQEPGALFVPCRQDVSDE